MRSATGRRCGSSRVYSMKPVALPMYHLLLAGFGGNGRSKRNRVIRLLLPSDAEHAFVLMRKYLDKFGQHGRPVLADPLRARTSGRIEMSANPILQKLNIGR